MNDKNFIEELRQKREEYGVTQRKLAVACGISRTYFNQIENGTVVPSAELKQTIEKQIERFNPQELYWSSFLVTLCSEIMLYIETPLVSYSYSLNEVSHSCTS